MTINSKHLIQTIEEAGFEARSYSGRGMYGKKCVGVELDRGISSFKLGVQLCLAAISCLEEDEAMDFIEEMACTRTCEDSMGLDSITYWPGVEWVDDDEEAEDEEAGEPGQTQTVEP